MNLLKKIARVHKQKYSDKAFHITAILLVFLFSIVIVICLWGTKLIKKDHYTNKTEGNFYQYMGDSRIEYSGEVAIEKLESENRNVITNNGVESDIDGTPLYFCEDERLYTISECLYQDPEEYAPSYVGAYTEVYLKDGIPWAKIGDNMVHLNGGFLYDGVDLYIFLEPVSLEVNEEEIPLTALSYTSVVYGQEYIAYDYGSNQYIQKEIKQADSITAEFQDGRKIDLGSDILYDKEGNWQLLVTTPDVSKPLK